jgi:uncharacterized membrane protein
MDLLESGSESEAPRDYGLERLAMLSDAVFAIAMTLLALDLKAPPNWDGSLADLFVRSDGQFGAFFTSFGLGSMYWIYHRRTFRLYRRSDGVLSLLNLLVLGLVVLLPFATRLYTGHTSMTGAVDIYLGELAAIGCMLALQWSWAAFAANLTTELTLAFRIFLFCNILLVPITMATLGVLMSRPGWWFALPAMVALWAINLLLRRKFARDMWL